MDSAFTMKDKGLSQSPESVISLVDVLSSFGLFLLLKTNFRIISVLVLINR